MSELDRFIQNDKEPSLEDFISEDNTISVHNRPSNINLSTYAAALSQPEDAINIYLTTNSELEINENSETFKNVMNKVKGDIDLRTRAEFKSILSDQSIPESDKTKLVEAYTKGFKVPDASVAIAQNSLNEESGESTTFEHDIIRLNTVDKIDQINVYNKTLQGVINNSLVRNNESTSSKVVDFLETILPFGEGKQAGLILGDLRKEGDDESRANAIVKGISLLGSTKAEIRDTMAKVPPEKRLELTQSLISIINEHDGIALPDGNYYSSMEILRAGLEAGYYSDSDEWIDNFVSILDMSIIGSVFTKPLKAITRVIKGTLKSSEEFIPKGLFHEEFMGLGENASVQDIVSTVNRRLNKSGVQPSSLSQIYKDTNVSKARVSHEAVALDDTGEAAKALYGTSREEAIAHDLLPEMAEANGTVKSKLPRAGLVSDLENTPNAKVMDFANSDGAIYFWKSEKRDMESRVTHDFKNAMGITTRDDMFQVVDRGGGIDVRAVYTQTDNGWSNADDAVKAVKFALRDYGVTDDAIEVLVKTDGDFFPSTLADIKAKEIVRNKLIEQGKPIPAVLKQPTEFAVGVKSSYSYNPADVMEFEKADVKWNLFDRVPAFLNKNGTGSFQRHILDAHSMLHPNLTLGANVSVDKAVGLERALSTLGKDYASSFNSLSKNERAVINDIIKEMNAQSRSKTTTELRAAGISDEGIKALKLWKESWDTVYWLENADLARTLRARNFKIFVDEVNETRVFAKPMAHNQFSGNVKVYNQSTDTIEILGKDELKKIYDDGGTLAQLRNKIDVDEDYAEFIKIENTQDNYLRTINNNDQVLNYREGYYQVQYKDPRFIIEEVVDSSGKFLYEKAVATSGNIKDADEIVARLSKTSGKKYSHRGDRGKRARASSDDYWNVQTAAGRTAQKIRGKRLEDATSTITNPSHENILDPVTALSKSIRGLSRRVSMRNYLETTKARFTKQYGHLLPENKYKQASYPNSVEDIVSKSDINSKELADARTTYEYIQYLENGYINSIDDVYKSMLNSMADMLGTKGLSTTESLVRGAAEARGPAGGLRNAAFKMYLATNPLRQQIIQSHQTIQLAANFPLEMANPQYYAKIPVLAAYLRKVKISDLMLNAAGLSRKEADEMFRAFERSGLHAAVDANNLVRSDLVHLADMTVGQKIGSAVSAPINLAQKVGFDFGEQLNVTTAWLAHRSKAIREGKVLNDETYDMIAAEARNYTYNMNAAGDMPYNQNYLNVLFQFMQVPHKAMTQMITNRVLTKAQKGRLIAFNTLMYGLPTGLMANWIGDIYPDNQVAKDAINFGFETVFLNASISVMTGEDSRIDFSDLAPNDVHGVYESMITMLTTDVSSLLTESPSGQLFFGGNPRVTNAFKTAARYFGLIDDYVDPTEFGTVAKSFAQLSSGMSNAFKAAYALEYGKKINSTGGVVDKSVTTAEAIAQAFGFGTLDEAYSYKVKDTLYGDSKHLETDVATWYRGLKQHLTRKDITNSERDFSLRVQSEAWRVFSKVNDMKARDEVFKLLRNDLKAGDVKLINNIFKHMNWGTEGDLKKMIEEVPLEAGEEWKRDSMRKTLKVVMDIRGE